MDEGASSQRTDTPEGSGAGDDYRAPSAPKTPAAVKDRKCQYCNQSFTSSSLGRHLDQFLFKKKPDGIHDVEEIRRIRSGITRRQARTSSGKRESPDGSVSKAQKDGDSSGALAGKAREGGVRMMFNMPTWHATGVINDIPNPIRSQEGPGSSYFSTSQSRSGSMGLPDYASRGGNANSADTAKALELALREVLDNIKAATAVKLPPRLSPFDFDMQAQTFPSLCLQLLPPPPTLFSPHPFASPSSFPLQPPGVEYVDIVRQALRSKIVQWQNDHLTVDPSQSGRVGLSFDPNSNMIAKNAQQHEDISARHLDLAFKHWISLPLEVRQEAWQLEITRAFAREAQCRKSVENQLARVQQEANQLRAQVERLGSCQWPREFALFPPDVLPIPRDVARELDAQESIINPNSTRWDYDQIVAKWKRVVMHDRSMGRVGVGQSKSVADDYSASAKPLSSDDANNKSRAFPSSQSGPSPDPSSTSNHIKAGFSPSPKVANHPSPNYAFADSIQSSQLGGFPQGKRPRLTNGHCVNAQETQDNSLTPAQMASGSAAP